MIRGLVRMVNDLIAVLSSRRKVSLPPPYPQEEVTKELDSASNDLAELDARVKYNRWLMEKQWKR